MILRILSGDSLIDLTANTLVRGVTYFPVPPGEREVRTQANSDEGETLTDIQFANVTESCEVICEGAPASIRSLAQQISGALQDARLAIRTVYVEYSPVGSALLTDIESTYRSQILKGRLVWATVPGRRRLGDTTTTVSFTLIWERKPFWEGPEVELPLTAFGGSTAILGGRTIRNHTDSGAGNWVQIAGVQVTGDLPAPVRLKMKNVTGGSHNYRGFFFSVNATNPSAFVHTIQGESVRAGLGTVVSSGTASGGQYVSAAFTGTYYLMWDLPAILLQNAAGRRFKALARFTGFSTTAPIYVQPAIREQNGLTTLWEGDEVALPGSSTSAIIDLGRSIPLPPSRGTRWGLMTLALKLRSTVAATVNLDFIQLFSMDSYRRIAQRALTINNNSFAVDDNIDNVAYIDNGVDHFDVFAVPERRLYIYPGRDNRILILHDEGTFSTVANQFTVQIYYRTRRLTV